MNKLKNEKVTSGYRNVSFDVEPLFTNVLLDETIQLVLKRIYEKYQVLINIIKPEMKEMLIICAKNVHFVFNEDIPKQTDGVAMRFPLFSVFADIFIVELDDTIDPV